MDCVCAPCHERSCGSPTPTGMVWEVGHPCEIPALVGRSRAMVCSRPEVAVQESGRGSWQNLTRPHPDHGLSASGAGGATCSLSSPSVVLCYGGLSSWRMDTSAWLPPPEALTGRECPVMPGFEITARTRAADSPAVLSAQLRVPTPQTWVPGSAVLSVPWLCP